MYRSQSELYEEINAVYGEAKALASKAQGTSARALSYGRPYEKDAGMSLEKWEERARVLYDDAGELHTYPQPLRQKAERLEALASQILGLRASQAYSKAEQIRKWASEIQTNAERVLKLANTWQSELNTFHDIMRESIEDSDAYWTEFGEYYDD